MLVESILSFLAALGVFFQRRTDTALEILALRQQVAVLKRKRPRPDFELHRPILVDYPSPVLVPLG